MNQTQTRVTQRSFVQTLRLAVAAGSCLLSACATFDQTHWNGEPTVIKQGAPAPAAASAVHNLSAPDQALAPSATSHIALASHHQPAAPSPAPQQPAWRPSQQAVYHAPLAHGRPPVSTAPYYQPPGQTGGVQLVDWSQCPSCLPVTIPGPDCFSVEVDAQMALRYRDEYICDGGDANLEVRLDKRMKPNGLDQEDTVAHYVTEDGKVVVEPSTRTCIYAPRFAAVRQIHTLAVNEQSTSTAGIGRIAALVHQSNLDTPLNLEQPVEPKASRAASKLHVYNGKTATAPVTGVANLFELGGDLLPFEDNALVRQGLLLGSEKLRLAIASQNAVAWTGDMSVEAILDETPAVEAANVSGPQETFEFITPKGKPKLRVVKLADRDNAHPSDEVNFTLRFDNIGDQAIKEVVLLDNLSTRLEYVEGSAQSTIKAKFSTEMNRGESLILRWELEEPLDVGKGGVIRFKCKVR